MRWEKWWGEKKEKVERQVMKSHYLKGCRYFLLKVIEFIEDFKIENDLICTLILEKWGGVWQE